MINAGHLQTLLIKVNPYFNRSQLNTDTNPLILFPISIQGVSYYQNYNEKM